MEETIYKIALAGLLHDIGKFMQRAELEKEFPEIKSYYDEFCPIGKSGYPTHLHAAHTAYFIEKFIPEGCFDKTELFNAALHHKNAAGDIYREADCLSAGMERYEDETSGYNFKDIRLRPVFDSVEVQYQIHDKAGNINSRWHYELNALSSQTSDLLYPVFDEEQEKGTGSILYRKLWNAFEVELKELNHINSIEHYFIDVLWLLEKYTWSIPSATNVFPDISLFDHLKTTSAIASCYYWTNEEKVTDKADFILYAGDIAGIQDYIFKISRTQGIGGISKRLRGRSFYILILAEILSRYIINNLQLTVANINYCGGGNFEILLPNTKRVSDFLDNFNHEINQWLLQQFNGSLGYVDAMVKMSSAELRDRFGERKDVLSDILQKVKQRKYKSLFESESFWVDKTEIDGRITICPSCNVKLIRIIDSICDLCSRDKEIGQFLPQAGHIMFSQSEIPAADGCKPIMFGKFGTVSLFTKDTKRAQYSGKHQALYSITDNVPGIKARYFLAQTLPVAMDKMELETEKDEDEDAQVDPGQTLSFSTLADMSRGDKRIGILKMDMDNLGLIFSLGLDAPSSPKHKGRNLRSISRLSTLSRELAFFFTEFIDFLCKRVFENWLNDDKNTRHYKNTISSIFYLIFSGGDDLVIVGPWDRVIELSRLIRKAFKEYTCHNPNITISAGIYICKPKFPISAAIEKAEEALNQSKDRGKNRITVMGETAVWDCEDKKSRIYQKQLEGRYPGTVFDRNEIHSEKIYVAGALKDVATPALTFEQLSDFADLLHDYYESKNISRHFICQLLRAKKEFFKRIYNDAKDRYEEDHNLMFLPHLLYNIERNTASEVKSILKGTLITPGDAQKYVRQAYYPCKYVLIKTK